LSAALEVSLDSAWEQEKLEARKLPENAQNLTNQVHAYFGCL
jgi:hypothetical protein